LSATQAITLFHQQVKWYRGLPFEVRVPNEVTLRVFRDIDAGQNIVRTRDVEDMFQRPGRNTHLSYTNQFEPSLQRSSTRCRDAEELKIVITTLVEEEPLPERYRDHVLIGNYRGRRECHIEADWLLIYKLVDDEIMFERTGTHSDLLE
jgi:mRNA interferase YafQ